MKLDQFFTKPHIAAHCWRVLCPLLSKLTEKDPEELYYVEPAAGDGVFYDLLPPDRRMGIDIDPRRSEFLRHDFISWNPKKLRIPSRDVVVIGNPPFGKRGDMAVQFMNSASHFADTVAFIVPVIFRKYFIHRRMPEDFRWVCYRKLPRASFCTPNKKEFSVNSEFHVWTRIVGGRSHPRLLTPPPIQHDEFKIWQYNNTIDALKVFENDFEFAIPCQGWQDYGRREMYRDNCETNKQWMLFKPLNDMAYERLFREIDYGRLAGTKTTSVPGFRKGDIVQEYVRRYG